VTIAKERFSLPRKPVVPDKPKPRSSFLLSPYPRTPFVVPNLTGFTQPPAITWLGFKTNKLFHVLSFEVRKLNHGYSEECPKSPYIVFDSFDAMSSFKIEYEITAANIPGKSEGFLHVIVKD
jgi:hypothetical protein